MRSILVLLVAITAAAPTATATLAAQPPCPNSTTQGCFEPPFNHENNSSYFFDNATWISEMGMNRRFNALHVALIPTPGPLQGKVLAWDYGRPDCERNSPGTQRWSIIDPTKPSTDPEAFWNFTLPIAPTDGQSNDIACAGFTWLEDGRMLVAGGTEKYAGSTLPCPAHTGPIIGAKLVFLFDPTLWNPSNPNAMWVPQASLTSKRYYPTLALGKWPWVYIARGHTDDTTYGPNDVIVPEDFEVWDRLLGTARTDLGNLLGPNLQNMAFAPLLVYPRMHLLSTGEMFLVGMDVQSAAIREPTDPWVHKSLSSLWCRWYGTSVLFPNIDPKHTDAPMILDGQSTDFDVFAEVLSSVQICKGSATDPTKGFNDPSQGHQWTPVDGSPGTLPSMSNARIHLNAILLPDASVLVIGGTRTLEGVLPADYVYTAERFKGGQWETLATMQVNRRYHATTLLLPSGQVLVAGGEGRALDYEVYNPPYIYKPRPTVTGVPQNVFYGGTYQVHFTLPTGAAFGRIVLMRPGCNTHQFDADQRYYQTTLVPVLEGQDPSQSPRSFALPLASDPNRENKLPPGWYMLHVVTADGTPSVAHWIKVKQ